MFLEINPAFLVASLYFLVSICYLILCIITFVNSTKSKMRNQYISSGASLLVGSFSYGMMTISNNEIMCQVFWAVGFASLALFFARWLAFSSSLIEIKNIYLRRFIASSTLLTLIIAGMCIFSNETVFFITKYGVQFSYSNSVFFKVAIIFFTIVACSFIIIFLQWWRKSEIKRNRVLGLMFLITTIVMTPISYSTDFLIPTFTDSTAIPLAVITFLPISLPLIISMLRNKTLSITVPNASGYIFNTVTIPTLVLDLHNNIKLENKASLDFFEGSVLENNISEILLPDKNVPDKSLLDSGFLNEKVSVKTPQGKRICDMLLAVENDKYGDILCKVVLLRDITENEIKDKFLHTALEQANAANKTKSHFLSDISHEIRTPVNAISRMITDGQLSNTIEKKDSALAKMERTVKHLFSIINDVLDMSKIEFDELALSEGSFEFEKMDGEINIESESEKCSNLNYTIPLIIDTTANKEILKAEEK